VQGHVSLLGLDMFQELSPDEGRRLQALAMLRRIPHRDVISLPGPTSGLVCILAQGLAKVTRLDANGNTTLLYLIKSGELLGGSVWDPRDDMRLVALQPCVTACIRLRDLEEIVGKKAFASRLDAMRANRVRRMEDRLSEVTAGRVPARIARTIMRLCREFPNRMDCGTMIDIRLTQEEIASMICATREATSTTLNQFRRRGWLGVHDHQICVHDAQSLNDVATIA